MRSLLIVLLILCGSHLSKAQCTDYTTNGFAAGNLTFNSGTCDYQTITVDAQDYFTISVTSGNDYYFDFCGNGGNPGGLYPNMSLLNGATLITSDLWDGTCASITWTATFTGTVYLYITDDWDGCAGAIGAWSGTMAYNEDDGSSNASFTLSSTSCTGVSANITGDSGGTFSFNPDPGDGATINAGTGEISNGAPGSNYSVDYTVCGVTTNETVTLSTGGNASFSLNASCGGAVPIISGDQGGTFSFNPIPGGGAQVNPSSGVVSNAIAGNTYYVEYSVCGVSTTESVTVLDDDCFTLNNDAQYITVNGEQCIQLTAASNGQTGCAWNGNQIDFNNDFSLNLDYYFGSNPNGADGNTFTFQPSSSSSCGQTGAQLGAGGISSSLIVEFDTYDNDGGTAWDLSSDHIAVEIDGDLIDDPSNSPANSAPFCGPVTAKPSGGNIDDGNIYAVEIQWNASAYELSVYFDGNLRLTCTHDFVTNVFGGQSQVYWGATAATGGLNNQQYFCPSTVVILPVELNSFYSQCADEREVFYWESESEINLESYDLEYTYDGIIFYPVKSVEAVGTTDQKTQYSVSVESNDQDMRYYRLKMRDIDGRVETSDLIASKSCHRSEGGIIHTIAQTSHEVTVNLKELGELFVFDSFGKSVYKSPIGLVHSIDTYKFSTGIYIIKVIDTDGLIRDLRKIIKSH